MYSSTNHQPFHSTCSSATDIDHDIRWVDITANKHNHMQSLPLSTIPQTRPNALVRDIALLLPAFQRRAAPWSTLLVATKWRTSNRSTAGSLEPLGYRSSSRLDQDCKLQQDPLETLLWRSDGIQMVVELYMRWVQPVGMWTCWWKECSWLTCLMSWCRLFMLHVV
jgi:hypothetical protein